MTFLEAKIEMNMRTHKYHLRMVFPNIGVSCSNPVEPVFGPGYNIAHTEWDSLKEVFMEIEIYSTPDMKEVPKTITLGHK